MTKRKYKPWTQADDAELVLMREASTPTTLIAKALKRTHSSVTNRIATLDIPYGREQFEMDLGNFPKIETVQGSQPKPNWWTRIMWWRK
tara:strand:- start:560 stop:826 length:267 start_codon:yes stop_codon:yes gene_type:complete